MAEEFNPYTEWLEIPATELPPDHYILLGLQRFESNRERIAEAADERMELLRGFQNGQRGLLSQELLNEIASARLCLLDEKQRVEYDRVLAADLKRLDLPPMPCPVDLVPEHDMPMRAPDHIRKAIPADPDALLSPTGPQRYRQTIEKWIIPSVIGGLAVVALIVALIIRQM